MTSVILPEARANFVFLFKPRKNKQRPEAEPAYSVVLAFDKNEIDDTEGFKELKAEMLALAREKVGDNALKLLKTGRIANPIKDGESMVNKDGDPMEDFEDCYVITARRRADLGPPGLVDQRVRPIIDQTEIYSGMRCIASVNPFWYEVEGRRGIGIGLNNVQKVADGERIGGKPDPKSEFQPLKSGKKRKSEEDYEDDDIPF